MTSAARAIKMLTRQRRTRLEERKNSGKQINKDGHNSIKETSNKNFASSHKKQPQKNVGSSLREKIEPGAIHDAVEQELI